MGNTKYLKKYLQLKKAIHSTDTNESVKNRLHKIGVKTYSTKVIKD